MLCKFIWRWLTLCRRKLQRSLLQLFSEWFVCSYFRSILSISLDQILHSWSLRSHPVLIQIQNKHWFCYLLQYLFIHSIKPHGFPIKNHRCFNKCGQLFFLYIITFILYIALILWIKLWLGVGNPQQLGKSNSPSNAGPAGINRVGIKWIKRSSLHLYNYFLSISSQTLSSYVELPASGNLIWSRIYFNANDQVMAIFSSTRLKIFIIGRWLWLRSNLLYS